MVHNSEVKIPLVKLLKLQPIDLSPYFLFMGHDYLQHAGGKYHAYKYMRYHLHIMASDQPKCPVICYGHGSDINIGSPVSRPSNQKVDDDELHIKVLDLEWADVSF